MMILAFLDQTVGKSQEPLDYEADAIIRAYFKRHPDAAYRLTKHAMANASFIKPSAERPKNWLTSLLERMDFRTHSA